MMGFTLHLQGPMMSFGDAGFGQLRDAGGFPSRSAVLGIVAAAAGIRRNDERLLELHSKCRVHVAAVRAGSPGVDYHIVRPFRGYEEDSLHLQRRPAEDVSSVITYREYLYDAHFIAVVECRDEHYAEWCRTHLRDPLFVSYLGRRSCPPATPLLPGKIQGQTLQEIVPAALADWYARQPDGYKAQQENVLDVWLDKDTAPDGLPELMQSSRFDRLVALPRTFVARPVIHTRIALPLQESGMSTNQEYFDAAP